MQELASPSLLFIFVRHGIESTLERSAIAREHMGRLSEEQMHKVDNAIAVSFGLPGMQ